MAECIESGECFSALLFLQISGFFGIVPAGLLSEWTLYPRAFLPDDSEAGTFTLVVLLSLTVFTTINYLVIQRQNPIGRSVSLTFAGVALMGLVGNPSCEGMAHRQGANRARAQVKDP